MSAFGKVELKRGTIRFHVKVGRLITLEVTRRLKQQHYPLEIIIGANCRIPVSMSCAFLFLSVQFSAKSYHWKPCPKKIYLILRCIGSFVFHQGVQAGCAVIMSKFGIQDVHQRFCFTTKVGSLGGVFCLRGQL